MGNFKVIKFNSTTLNALKEAPNSGVEAVRTKKHLAVHPIHLNDFGKSVKDLLNEDVAGYSKDLDGILLGYENIKLLSTGGTIHSDSYYIHIDIEADFFVFRPKIGEEMRGIVTRKNKDHVGVLVYDTFNVSIPADEEVDHWMGKDVQVGFEVTFRIVYFSITSYLPYIRGQLISIDSKYDKKVSKKGNKKPIKNKMFAEDPEQVIDILTSPKENKKSNKKSRKSKEDNDDSLLQIYSINENQDTSSTISESKHKHKKRIYDTSPQEESGSEMKEQLVSNHDHEDIELYTKKQKRKRSLSTSETMCDENEVKIKRKRKSSVII